MPSPSPNSRKTSSSVSPRNLATSARGDLLLQGSCSSNGSAITSPCGTNDEHKENNRENGNGRGFQGRSQHLGGASKKPWVTHFSKQAGTLSPSNRILVDRNSSCSPLRSGGVIHGYGEGRGDKKVRATPPREREEPPATQGPSKGVAELSKRIQQFLEEQDVLVVKAASAQEVTYSGALSTPVNAGQNSASSPYNPYKSPFFERPKYLRLNGSSSSTMDEVDEVSTKAEVAMEQRAEELPLFEGGQVLATPLQQIQFSIDLSPFSTEDEDKASSEKFQEQLGEATLYKDSVGDLQTKIQPLSENNGGLSHGEEFNQGSPCSAVLPVKVLDDAVGAKLYKAPSEEFQEQLGEATLYKDSAGDLQTKIQPLSENNGGLSHGEEFNQGLPCLAVLPVKVLDDAVGAEHSKGQSQVRNTEVREADGRADVVVKAKVHFALAIQPEGKADVTGEAENEAREPQLGDMKNSQGKEGAEGLFYDNPPHVEHMEVEIAADGKEDMAAEVELKSQPQGKAMVEFVPVNQPEGNEDIPQGKGSIAGTTYEDLQDVDEEACWGRRAGRVSFWKALPSVFVIFIMLLSTGPGLLPSSFVDKLVHFPKHFSKYPESPMLLVSGTEGLWSTYDFYLPVDMGAAVEKSLEMLHFIRKLSTQMHLKVQISFHLTSSILDDWRKVLFHQLSLRKNPSPDLEQEERSRQFEWLHDYEFDEEWPDEIPTLAYTDWELLHEYDLGAANQYILGSISDVLRHNLWKNFSRLSDSPEVKCLLEDLMKLKGGNTEEDRLEVLQYFWEYTRFSAHARETLVQSQVRHIGVNTGSQNQTLSLDFLFTPPSKEHSTNVPDFAMDGLHSLIPLHGKPPKEEFTDGQDLEHGNPNEQHLEHGNPNEEHRNEGAEVDVCCVGLGGPLRHIPPPDGPGPFSIQEKQSGPEFVKELQGYLADGALNGECLHKVEEPPAAALSGQVGIEKKLSDHEGSEQLWESLIHFPNGILVQTEELKSESVDMVVTKSSTYLWTKDSTGEADIRTTKISANLNIAHVAMFAIIVVASMFVVARSRHSKSGPKLVSSASTSVQFLRKATDQAQESLHGWEQGQPLTDMNQDKQQVTLIEELNDKFASKLQSPEPISSLQSQQRRRDEDVLGSPIPASASSPYGSFTTYKLVSKKEGQAGETKLTPVRRSSRIRNHISMSPQTNAVKRIAISPP